MSSYLSIIIFLLSTVFYYTIIKLPFNIVYLTSAEEYTKYAKSSYFRLFLYFLLVVVTQFGVNINIMINRCGGSVSQNIAAAALMTFIPWTFIFGVAIAVLIMYPSFKTPFSNVIGYFIVSGKANTLLSTQILRGPEEMNVAINGAAESERQSLHAAAETIIKICGNLSVLINNITPDTFIEYWEKLKPLMKDNVYTNGAIKQQLLSIVVERDNIGEALWYIYTACLVTSVVQYNMATRPCAQNLASLQTAYQDYLETDNANEAAAAKNSREYTVG